MKCTKRKNARVKRAKLPFFLVKVVKFLLLLWSWLLKIPIINALLKQKLTPSLCNAALIVPKFIQPAAKLFLKEKKA